MTTATPQCEARPLTLGFSPCPNDTFIFHALVHGLIPCGGLTFQSRLEDVETLNRLALAGQLQVSKVSYHLLGHILDDYLLLRSGGALGRGCGPLLVARQPLEPGRNIRQIAEDFVAGQLVVAAGTRLAPQHLMGLAACGVDEVPVVRAPRVAVLTTGNELADRGADLAPGRIRDANGPYLRALLPLLGAELVTVATAPDSSAELKDRLRELACVADLVLTTGGISAGRLDLLPAAVRELGGEILFHKVAIRPGKPLLHARLPGGSLLFGLPGNPLAVAVGLRFFVVPALRALQGLPPEAGLTAVSAGPSCTRIPDSSGCSDPSARMVFTLRTRGTEESIPSSFCWVCFLTTSRRIRSLNEAGVP